MSSVMKYYVYKGQYHEGDEPVEIFNYRPVDAQMQTLSMKYNGVQVIEREIQLTSNEQQNHPSPGAETIDSFRMGK